MGPIHQKVHLRAGKVATIDMLVDTGATFSVIPPRLLMDSGELERRRRARRKEDLLSRLEYEVHRRLISRAWKDPELACFFAEVSAGKVDPHTASNQGRGSGLAITHITICPVTSIG